MKEFNSQICTNAEQSKRLLDLGLKPETADCQYAALVIDWKGNPISNPKWRFYDHNKGFIVQNFEQMVCLQKKVAVDELKPYKEEKTFPPYMDYDIKVTKEQEIMEEPKELLIGFTKDDEGDWILNTHKDYEIKEVDGKFKLIKKKPTYPKTYAECCKIVNASIFVRLVYNLTDGEGYSHDVDNLKIYDNIRRLKICRDAYWKIAGEELGLDKPWEPDFLNPTKETRYFLFYTGTTIENGQGLFPTNKILIFPTEEMRDTFYENFKDLIEQCKELL